jgi:hypothetical protein
MMKVPGCGWIMDNPVQSSYILMWMIHWQPQQLDFSTFCMDLSSMDDVTIIMYKDNSIDGWNHRTHRYASIPFLEADE